MQDYAVDLVAGSSVIIMDLCKTVAPRSHCQNRVSVPQRCKVQDWWIWLEKTPIAKDKPPDQEL